MSLQHILVCETSCGLSVHCCIDVCQYLNSGLPFPHIGKFLSCQTAAFGKGAISLPKLLELVVCPFLKAAKKINEDPSEGPKTGPKKTQHELRNAMLDGWGEGLQSLLDGGLLVNPEVEGPLVSVSLTTAKQQAEIQRALLDTGFFKVTFADGISFQKSQGLTVTKPKPRFTCLGTVGIAILIVKFLG